MKRISVIALLFFFAACAPQEQEYHPTASTPVLLDKNSLHTADAAQLPYREWLPDHKAKAIIIALHGFNDYSHAFEDAGDYFSSNGIAVYAYDQRGFGETEDIGLWANQDNLVNDLKQFVSQVQTNHPHTPVYILGESMGGAVAIVALADPTFPKVQGLILSAPAVWGEETMNPLYRTTLWLAAHTLPSRKFTGSNLKIIACSNIPMLRSMAYDPLVIKETRVDAIYGLVELMDSAYQDIPHIHTPTLLLYGAKDEVISKSPIASARTRFTQDITYAYYPEGYHMLLRDLEREVVMEDVFSWISNPAEELPSGFETDKND